MVLGRKLVVLCVAAAALMFALSASPAGAHELLEFEKEAALAANGPIPPVPANPLEEAKEVCGSETAVFGSELFTTPPSQIKVKNEWSDIVPDKEMEISGTISNVELSGGDLSIDHPFSTDFTFDVLVDEPYWPLARQLGTGSDSDAGASEHELHMELEVGQLLHSLPQYAGPAEGEPWQLLPFEQEEPPTPTLDTRAHENLEAAYIPQVGERIAMKGRWIIDCGHNDFHAELHPITMAAFAHAEGAKTVVHVISNPYRVTQLYGAGTGELNSTPKGVPFPEGLEAAIKADVEKAIGGVKAPISMPVGLERTKPSTTPFIVCPPEGAPAKTHIHRSFVKREGVGVNVKRLKQTNCATGLARVGRQNGTFGHYTALQPPVRTCVLPWNLVTAEVAGGLGITGQKHDEVERIFVNAAGGTFTISHSSETTGPIAYNASPAEVRAALEALTSIGPGNVFVEGGPGGEGAKSPYTIVFVGSLAEQAVTPLTTDRSGLVAGAGGVKLATVVVVVPGGELDLHRFILSLVEQQQKATLESFEEKGIFVGAISRIEENIAKSPLVACVDPMSAALPTEGIVQNNEQPFPYYGEITIE
jgi:hypothetical protein